MLTEKQNFMTKQKSSRVSIPTTALSGCMTPLRRMISPIWRMGRICTEEVPGRLLSSTRRRPGCTMWHFPATITAFTYILRMILKRESGKSTVSDNPTILVVQNITVGNLLIHKLCGIRDMLLQKGNLILCKEGIGALLVQQIK